MTHLGMGADYASMSMLSARASPMLDVPLYDMPLPGGQTIATYGAPPSTSSSMPFQVSPQASTSNVYTGSGGIFAGSPAYKRRRLRSRHATSPSVIDQGTIPLHRALTPQASYTSSSMRSITASPRMHSQVPGRVSGTSRSVSSTGES